MTDTDIWNWISAFIQSFAETFLLVNVYCAFLGQPRIKKYVAYSLISCFAIAYCVFINVFTLPTYLRYSLSLCVFFAYSMAWNGPGWKRLFAVCTDVTINALASSIVYWLIDFMRTDRGTCLTIDSVLFATPNVLILVTISMIFRYFYSSAWENLKVSPLQWLILTLYPGVAFLVTISLFSIPVWDIGNHILLIVDAVGLLLAMVIHFVLVDLLNEHNTKTKQDKLLHQQIQMESEKANALYDVYLQQRHLTHDFTNQLNTIAGLLEQGDTASALDLIRSSSTEIHINTLVVNTGNPMIDTLLSQKYNEAQKKSIPVLFSLCDLSECPISSRDLLVLLGNLVDNAIEASEKMANPCIKDTPYSRVAEQRIRQESNLQKVKRAAVEKKMRSAQHALERFEGEILKCLDGTSCFTEDMIAKQIRKSQKDLDDAKAEFAKLQKERINEAAEIRKLRSYYDDFRGWADEFDSAPLEIKRTILSQLIDRVEVGRKYAVTIKFNMSYQQFLECDKTIEPSQEIGA